MRRNAKQQLAIAGGFFLAFAIFTALAAGFDVQPIGPEGSEVGFAAINQFVFQKLGMNLFWLRVTDYLGVFALLVMAAFAVMGMIQLIRRRSIRKVDGSILLLGALYALLAAFYGFFEVVVVNCRPVLVDGILEASYPSSHTMLVICVMVSAADCIRLHVPERKGLCIAAAAAVWIISAVAVVGRLLSGMHWFTDIAGGILLSLALIFLYRAALSFMRK